MNEKRKTFAARLFENLQPTVSFIYRRYGLVILAALLVTLGALYLLIGGLFIEGGPVLKVNTDLASLIPESYKSVQALEKIQNKVSGIDKLEILIQSEDFQSSLKFAKDLVPKLMEIKKSRSGEPFISSVEYRNPVEFFEKNQLLFLSQKTLLDLQQSIEDRIQKEKDKLNPLFVEDLFGDGSDEDSKVMSLADLEKKYEEHVPNEYLASEDSTILMLRLYPFGSALNLANAQELYAKVQELIADEDPTAYHPSMFVELGGEVRNKVEEYEVITSDATRNLIGGMLIQILLIIVYFRQPIPLKQYPTLLKKTIGFVGGVFRQFVAALLIALPLIMSIIWTFGLTALVIGSLNTITVFLFVILFGMGIDFGIHIYSRYLETRLTGADVITSLKTTILKTGAGIFTAAITTAAAFYALQVADFKGFSDFGFIAGTGILCSMLSMLFILPAFITLGERIGIIGAVKVTLGESEQINRKPLRNYRPIVITGITLVVVVAFFLPKLSFEYNFRELRANLPELQSVKAKIHDLKMDAEGEDLGTPAIILADSHEDLQELVQVLNDIKDQDTESPTIAKVESIFDKFPHDQGEKLAIIREIRKTVDDEGLDLVKGEDKKRLEKLRKALEVDDPFTLDEVPLSVKRKFIGKDGSIGEFVLIYPGVLLRDARNSIEFAKDLNSLSTMDGIHTPSGKTYYASSGSIVAADMLLLMQRDSEIAISLTTLMIALFLFLDLRSVKRTLLVLSPLVVGFFWLFAMQLIFGLKYNLYNMVVLPVIIGYGVDDGVHLMHRYLEEGAGSLHRVLRTTGWAVVMTTVTTCAGFAGLIFVRHGGLQSMGLLAVIGLMSVMIASLLFLPAALQWLELRQKKTAAAKQ